MKSTLRGLYDGDICPAEQRPLLSEEYRQILESQEQHESDLVSTLTEEQKEAFEKYKD